jgi:phosphonoacetaldehyde hydrolase
MSGRHLEMVVFDWAGTTVDYGSLAPILALEQTFATAGAPVPRDLLRTSMGLSKKDHIRAILALPEVREDWATIHHTEPDERDVDSLYAGFTPRMIEAIAPSAVLIPGVAAVAARLRERGVKIGSTTGYTRPMLDRLLASAAAQGYAPDLSLCPDDAPGGRPAPWMCFRLAIELCVSALWRAVKIGDTESDIAEGLNAGMWTIGITRTGNCVGLSPAEWKALSPGAQMVLLTRAETTLLQAGAHYVVESVADCLPQLEQIEARIARSERP